MSLFLSRQKKYFSFYCNRLTAMRRQYETCIVTACFFFSFECHSGYLSWQEKKDIITFFFSKKKFVNIVHWKAVSCRNTHYWYVNICFHSYLWDVNKLYCFFYCRWTEGLKSRIPILPALLPKLIGAFKYCNGISFSKMESVFPFSILQLLFIEKGVTFEQWLALVLFIDF